MSQGFCRGKPHWLSGTATTDGSHQWAVKLNDPTKLVCVSCGCEIERVRPMDQSAWDRGTKALS